MTFPVPVDARAARAFEPVLGIDDGWLRVDMPLYDPTKEVAEGEFGGVTVADGVAKWTKVAAGVVAAAPQVAARMSWTHYVPGDAASGQGDAMATKGVTVITGKFQAKTTLFDAGGAYTPGNVLVVVHDATNDRGILYGVAAGSATAVQMASAVGKVISLIAGSLHFESI